MTHADNDLNDVYRTQVLEHSRAPRNFGAPAQFDRKAEGHNPLCGDSVTVYAGLDGDRLDTLCFDGSGCAISIASASMMTEALRGLTQDEAATLVNRVEALFESGKADTHLSELRALEGVRAYPSRIKCALLPWRTAAAALNSDPQRVNTEKG